MTDNDNLRGLPVVSPWDVLDAATRGEEWVTFGELKRAREQLATDYAALQANLAAAIARVEAAERIGLELQGRAQRAEVDAGRWKFWRDAAIDEDGSKRAAILAQPFPATKEQLDTAIDAAMAAEGRE